MRIGIVGEISGNVHALESADKLFRQFSVEHKFCVGNIVGMYPFVEQTVTFLIRNSYQCVKLPIDTEFCESCEYIGWGDTALFDAIRFSRSICRSSETFAYLRSLPEVIDTKKCGFFGLLGGRSFINDESDARLAFARHNWSTAFHSADRDPAVWYADYSYHRLAAGENSLKLNLKCFISAGSAGSKVYGSAGLGFPCALVYDDSNSTITVIKTMCNFKNVIQELNDLKYPVSGINLLEKYEYAGWR